ncbi:MAG: hypothetical protein JSU65_12765 [Candidatus Zixiibacteriota bacterium]|nr:MAG: hypothetical protein JSU65_12765 [candidate division Zixibacteria bacterium]
MTRIIILALGVVIIIGALFLANCSNPLDTYGQDGPGQTGPGIIVDTVIVIDTITVVDTVIIHEPDPGDWQTVCSILRANLNEIVWLFCNQEGLFHLEFAATAEREFSFRTLVVNIDGEEFVWNPTDDPVFSGEMYLQEEASIRVMPNPPCLLGHEIEICLTVSVP